MRIERSFIQVPGVGEKTEQRLWEAGIVDWSDQLDTSLLVPQTGKRLQRFADRAPSELHEGNVSFFAESLPSRERWRLLESFRERAVAIDIETTGLDPHRDVVTTVTLHGAGSTKTLIRDDDLTRDGLLDAIADIDLLLSFNGARFDLPFLEREFNIEIDHPHVDLRYPCKRLGWKGGLKGIERRLGISRDLPAVDGREAIRLWYRHRNGDVDALERLIRYNREDTRTLFPLADQIVSALDQEVIEPYLREFGGNVAYRSR